MKSPHRKRKTGNNKQERNYYSKENYKITNKKNRRGKNKKNEIFMPISSAAEISIVCYEIILK